MADGQRLTVVITEDKEGGEDVRKQYLASAFPKAKSHGMKLAQNFKVARTLIGAGNPEVLGLYTWPNAAASRRARAS